MRNRARVPAVSLAALVVCGLLTSCTHMVRTGEMGSLQTGSPLRGATPKTFAVREFRDTRGAESPTFLRKAGIHKWETDAPAASVVRRSICQELSRNGHTCAAATSAGPADFVVEGDVYKFGVRFEQGFFTASMIANVAVRLTVSRVPGDKGVLVKTYQGEAGHSSAVAADSKTAITQAMLAMMQEISTDPELVAFIEKSAR